MKMGIKHARHWVNRMYEGCGTFQWARELLTNSIEAHATRVHFDVEWQAVKSHGVYRRMIVDNGDGMDGEELLQFFKDLGEGGKPIGGVHDNFGVGAKIALLPWNPEGVVIISYKSGTPSMIWMELDEDTGEYEIKEFDVDDALRCVINPEEIAWPDNDVNWAALRPEWVADHGTLVVLLGSRDHPDTFIGNPEADEAHMKGLAKYLNTRFWTLPETHVTVTEFSYREKARWPTASTGDEARVYTRTVRGAKYFVCDYQSKSDTVGTPLDDGELTLDEGRVKAHWYLWEGARPSGIHPYAQKNGYIAVRYKNELYDLTSRKHHFRWFGIVESAVQQNVTIILEPRHLDEGGIRWGVHPDQSRNRLNFTGGGERGGLVPLAQWAEEFADDPPLPILDAIRAERGNLSGEIEDDEYRKRLQEKFGDRWRIRKRLINERGSEPGSAVSGAAGPQDEEFTDDHDDPGAEPGPGPAPGPRRRPKNTKLVPLALDQGRDRSSLVDSPVDVPRYELKNASDFEQPWHLAMWVPNDPAGPTVFINVDSPILQEAVEHHQLQFPDHLAEEVATIVRKTIGEIASCKVAHAQKLTAEISEEKLNQEYRNEAALTVALMGLMAEESLIARRLKQLGRKRTPESGVLSVNL